MHGMHRTDLSSRVCVLQQPHACSQQQQGPKAAAVAEKAEVLNGSNQPRNLLIFPLPGLHIQALLVHLVHVSGGLHVAQNVFLQLGHRLQRVCDILVLLNVADDFRCLGTLGEVDEVRRFDKGWHTIFDEREVGEVDACVTSEWVVQKVDQSPLPKKGIHGGLAECNVSRYSPKFFVLAMSLRICSRMVDVRALT